MHRPSGIAGTRLAALFLGIVLATPLVFAQRESTSPKLILESNEELATMGAEIVSHPELPPLQQPDNKSTKSSRAHIGPNDRPWWIAGELGEGQLKLTSDQSSGSRISTFELGFIGGHTLGSRARVGAEVSGWLIQAFNLNNPAVGESVSDVIGILDVFPSHKIPLLFRAGMGLGLYHNNRPNGFNGHGLAWTIGAGYEIPLTESLGLAPMAAYAGGSLGDVRNALTVQTNRRYSVIEFKAAVIWHFGHRRKSG